MKETVKDNEAEILICKILGLNNPKNYVLTHNRLKTYKILTFNDLNKAQI